MEFQSWDDGRMEVNPQFAELLRANALTSCRDILSLQRGERVRRVGSRETSRIELNGPAGMETLYLKRHGPPRWRDRIVPILRFSPPIVGARNEWNAIQSFVAAGIPTMVPVAFGCDGQHSFLMTQALPAKCNLLEWARDRPIEADHPRQGPAHEANQDSRAELLSPRDLAPKIADIARRMHSAGLHHQDFYLNHLLLCGPSDVRVIDLGRVRQHRRLGRRWIIKDLAQLDFSARTLSCRDRLRFLRLYLGRPLTRGDRWLIREISIKSRRIATHTAKHDL